VGCFRYIIVCTIYQGDNKDDDDDDDDDNDYDDDDDDDDDDNNNNNNNNNNNSHPQGDCGQKWAFDAATERRQLYLVRDYKVKWLKYQYLLLNNY